MNIDTRTRNELKAYFAKNAIPTDGDFAELIDAILNQKDDRVVKRAGEPLTLEASANGSGELEVLRLYESFDYGVAWGLTLKPRSDPQDSSTARSGLSFKSPEGEHRLFIDQATGNVGIGTLEPDALLTLKRTQKIGITQQQVGGSGSMELVTEDDAGNPATRLRLEGGADNADIAFYRGARGAESATVFVEGATGNVGIGTGTAPPLGRLQVNGAIVAAKGDSESAGILFIHDATGGDRGWVRYSTRSGDNNTLEIGTSDNTEDHVALMPSGHVGVKTDDPDASLHVASGVDATLAGGGYLLLGSLASTNVVFDDNEIMARNNGAAATLFLQNEGGDLVIDGGATGSKVGVGTQSPIQTLDVRGRMHLANGVIQRGGDAITNTSDLGLYSQVAESSIRIVSTNAPIRFYTDGGRGGATRMTIESSGNVIVNTGHLGIGTGASPGAKLTAVGTVRGASDAAETNYTEIGHDGANGYVDTVGTGNLELRHDGAAKVTVEPGGDVGIGTTAPGARLQIVGGAIMPEVGNSESAGILFPKDAFGGSGDAAYIRWYARTGEQTTLEIGVNNDGNDHLALMAAGNVGVGTTTPGTDLSVIGTVRGAQSGEGEYTEIGHDGTNGFINTLGSGNLDFRHDNADKMSLTSGGSLGIGTDSPDTKLSVIGTVRGAQTSNESEYTEISHDGTHGIVNTVGDGNLEFRHDGSTKMALTSAGSLGIGTSSPSARLQVTGGTTILEQEPWQTQAFQNGWVNYGTSTWNAAGYFKDSNGVVHLRGLVKNGAFRKPIFTLPAGYRPVRRELFATITSGEASARVDVLTDGQVYAYTGSPTWLSLDGLTFRAA